MKKNEFRVFLSILALIFSLGIFLGGYNLYIKWGLEKPLIKDLSSLSSVQGVSIEKNDQKYELKVKLKKVSNIQEQYKEIEKQVKSGLGNKEYELEIVDRRNDALELLFNQLQPTIYEAVANNRYLWLDEEVARRTAEKKMSYVIFIDEQNLYLQLMDGNAYLYEVINRAPEK